MMRILRLLLLGTCIVAGYACAPATIVQPESSVAEPDACVVLLHGLLRTPRSMNKIGDALAAYGYRVQNVGYPSADATIEVLAAEVIPQAVENCRVPGIERINFVTHSLGGILVRYYLENHEIEGLARVVMISPPNQGSELVDYFVTVPGFGALNGPSGYQLGTDDDSLPLNLGPAAFEVGIIAGDYTTNPVFSAILPGVDDGKVTVERAKLDGMTDFVVVHQSHSLIMRSDFVIEQVVYFLENGSFFRASADCVQAGQPVLDSC